MATATLPTNAEFKEIASLNGWAIADRYKCQYDGDSDPIDHGGFFYDPRDWEKNGYATTVEFWRFSEQNMLVVQRGTIHKPDDDKMEKCWESFGIADIDRTDIRCQILAVQSFSGIEPEGTRYPDLMEYKDGQWHEWRIWKSVHNWLKQLGD